MTSPKDLIDKAIVALQELSVAVTNLGDLEERVSRAKADIDSMNATTAAAKAQMSETQGMLSRAQADAQRKYDLDIFEKQGQLKSLNDRVEALRKEVAKQTEEYNTKSQQLFSIHNSMEEARRKLSA